MKANRLRIAVITPYYSESIEELRLCHNSVLAQKHECVHILVADGKPQKEINNWKAHHITLPVNHNDIGSTPRLIGSFHAIGLGVDAIAFLDADNWYHDSHISIMVKAYTESEVAFVTCSRTLCRIDGSEMGTCPLTDPNCFIDTNCMLFGRGAFHLLHNWCLMPDYGHLIGDRIMLHHLNDSGLKGRHLHSHTVYYRCKREGLYHHFKERVPYGVTAMPDYERSFRLWVEDGNAPLI